MKVYFGQWRVVEVMFHFQVEALRDNAQLTLLPFSTSAVMKAFVKMNLSQTVSPSEQKPPDNQRNMENKIDQLLLC